MRTLLVLTLTSALAFGAGGRIRRLDGSRIGFEEADAFARRTLSEAHVTGAQIAVLNGGRLVWSFAYGKRGVNPDLPMDRETTTWAASITKSVFATYAMHLVETGTLRLDEPVWQNVTPRMLLSHTSGLLNFASMEPDKQRRLHFTPGTLFNYSGEGFNVLQEWIEAREHKPIGDLMQEAIFGPLGMTRTAMTFRQEFLGDVADRFDLNEKFTAQTRRGPARAAGSMTTSAEDLARFASAFLAGKIIRPETKRQMLTPVIWLKTRQQFGSKPEDTDGTEGPRVGLAYGVGWGLLTKTPYGAAFFKEGHGDGAQNYMICFEKTGSCMIILTNSDNGELAFRPLLEKILGDTVTPWEWESYTPEAIAAARAHP